MSSPRISTPNRSRMMIAPSPKKKIGLKNSPMKQLRAVAIGSKVRVVARVRPASEQERSCIRIANGEDPTLEIEDFKTNKTESYKLDSCYDENADTSRIFKAEAEPVLPLLFCGCHATIFAYGTAGSGKTYTMQGCQEKPGLITLAIQHILSLASEKNGNWSVEVSYYELYQDRCYDLLEPTGMKLPVFEDSQGRIQLRGLSQVQVKQMSDFENLFRQGCAERKVGHRGSNQTSSISHTVFTITVTNADEANSTFKLLGKLNLIDLAETENESNSENLLSVLSNVISAVSANERRVPYRDSKLTRILQDSLAGTSCTVMISCLNPGSYVEACQTLSLGIRSKLIGEINETSSNKPDSESKTSDKGKPPKSPMKVGSPVQGRLFRSPSRFGPGQQRHATKRIVASPSCSPRKENIFSIYEELPVLEPSVSDDARDGQTSDPCPSDDTTSPKPCLDKDTEETDTEDKENVAVVCTPVQRISSCPADPPLSSMLRSLGTSLKEVATPGTLVRNLDLSLSQTPSTSNIGWTAVEKFTVSSKDLRSSLLKDYLDILNTGTREELLTLKGIGKKRADYILDLRESSSDEPPFVQLRDLQKIGLSAKQAEKLFHGNVVRQVLQL